MLRLSVVMSLSRRAEARVSRAGLESLGVGDMVVHDVTVRVATETSDLLLGQSFLRRLKSWSMDNARQVMILH